MFKSSARNSNRTQFQIQRPITRISQVWVRHHVKHMFLSDFYENRNEFQNSTKHPKYEIVQKSIRWELQTKERTDTTWLTVTFCNCFANAPKTKQVRHVATYQNTQTHLQIFCFHTKRQINNTDVDVLCLTKLYLISKLKSRSTYLCH